MEAHYFSDMITRLFGQVIDMEVASNVIMTEVIARRRMQVLNSTRETQRLTSTDQPNFEEYGSVMLLYNIFSPYIWLVAPSWLSLNYTYKF